MTVFNIFSLLGGLGMFLYGMKVMGDNLEKCAGGKLEKILEKLTSNKYKGILLGTFVTAVIQSSGAVTVMLVGFVNSGIMQLEQTVGVTLGASIGTTITAWFLSLSGLGGSSVALRMLKPESFSPLLIFLGGMVTLFLKKDTVKNVGRIILGFGILMYGMCVMSEAMSPLSDSASFQSMLTVFKNPVIGVIVGILFTTILQSCSASVGVLQALSVTGAITFGTAIPILIGENVGACTTALISSVNANRKAKQTAIVQMYYKVISAGLFILVYCILGHFIRFSFADKSINTFQIATIHTFFNVLTTIVMVPFTDQLIFLARKTIPESPEEKEDHKIMHIDDRLLKMPDVAIEPCKNAIKEMADLSFGNVDRCLDLLYEFDEKKYEKANQKESLIDNYEDVLATALSKISGKKSNAETSHTASLFIHAISDIERIGDHALNIAESAMDMHKNHFSLSDEARHEIKVLRHLMEDVIAAAFEAFKSNDIALAKRVEPMEEVMDSLSAKLKERNVRRRQEHSCAVQAGILYLDIINDFERICDHCSNLAIYVAQSDHDVYAVHEYSDSIKKDNLEFKRYYTELLDQYEQKLS